MCGWSAQTIRTIRSDVKSGHISTQRRRRKNSASDSITTALIVRLDDGARDTAVAQAVREVEIPATKKVLEEAESASSGLLLPARTRSHNTHVRGQATAKTLPDGRRRLGAATVAVPPATLAWCWSAALHRRLESSCQRCRSTIAFVA